MLQFIILSTFIYSLFCAEIAPIPLTLPLSQSAWQAAEVNGNSVAGIGNCYLRIDRRSYSAPVDGYHSIGYEIDTSQLAPTNCILARLDSDAKRAAGERKLFATAIAANGTQYCLEIARADIPGGSGRLGINGASWYEFF